jgi:hypothetical protein
LPQTIRIASAAILSALLLPVFSGLAGIIFLSWRIIICLLLIVAARPALTVVSSRSLLAIIIITVRLLAAIAALSISSLTFALTALSILLALGGSLFAIVASAILFLAAISILISVRRISFAALLTLRIISGQLRSVRRRNSICPGNFIRAMVAGGTTVRSGDFICASFAGRISRRARETV